MSVGIDIGSKTIKVVELKKEGNSFSLSGSGLVGYNGIPIEKIEDEKDFAPIATIIRKLHKDAKISKRTIGITIPESQVFTRVIKYPLLTDQEIASAMEWEVEQYIPIPKNEAVVQHQIIERNEKSAPPHVKVLLVAAPTILVEKYVRLFQMAGLMVDFIETDLLSLTRSVAPLQGTSLILDFGAKSTDIAITRDKHILFARSLPIAGDALTRTISQGLSIDPIQAEEYKKNYGLNTEVLEGKIEKVLNPLVRMISDEIKKAIHFYQTEEKQDVPKSVIITGGSAGLKEVVPLFTKLLNMEVEVGNPFNNIKINPETAKTLLNYSPLYAIAAGLAMREG